MQTGILDRHIQGDKVVLPVAGLLASRALAVPSFNWIGLNNYELVELAANDQGLFPLIFGTEWRQSARPISEFFPEGEASLSAPGFDRIVSDVARMRESWAHQWNEKYGLRLIGSQRCLPRRLNGGLLSFLSRNFEQLQISPDTLDRAGFPQWNHCSFSPDAGRRMQRAYLDELQATVQACGLCQHARKINAPPAARQLIQPTMDALSNAVKESNHSAIADLRRYLRAHGRHGLFQGSPTVPATLCSNLSSTRPINPSWPKPLAQAYQRWELSMASRLPTDHEVPTVQQLATIGIRSKRNGSWQYDRAWLKSQAEAIILDSGVSSLHEPKRVAALENRIRKLLKNSAPKTLPTTLHFECQPDEIFGRRLIVPELARYYARYEAIARGELAHSSDGVPSRVLEQINAAEPGNARPVLATHLLDREEHILLDRQKSCLRPENGWRAAISKSWIHGLIVLESSMRAYLRAAGLAYTPGRTDLTGEFWKLAFAPNAPAWRWQILREGYLAAWLWSWGQLLGNQSPFNPESLAHLHRGLSDWSRMFRVVWGRERLQEPGSRYQASLADYRDVVMWQLQSDWELAAKIPGRIITYAGKVFEISAKLEPSVLFVDTDTAINLLGLERSSQSYAKAEDMTTWINIPDYLRNVAHMGKNCAEPFKLIGNLMLAGHSRYRSLLAGSRIAEWVRKEKLNEIGLGLLAPFGLLPTRDWLKGPGLWRLFEDCGRPVQISRHRPLNLSRYDSWSSLTQEQMASLWTKVTLAPLSYPFDRPTTITEDLSFWGPCTNIPIHTSWPLQWFERLFEFLPRGLCPFSGQPLNSVPNPEWQEDKEQFQAWRQKVLGFLFSGRKLPTESFGMDTPVSANCWKSVLIPPLDSLLQNWLTR